MSISVEDKLAMGRLIAIRKAPYFRAMITSLVPLDCDWCGTIGVTATGLLPFNRAWIEKRNKEEMGALYWHEVMHLVLNHHGRRGDRDPYLWNVAGDIFINDQGRSTLNLVFPAGGWFPELIGAPKNLSADEYYALLLKMGKEAVEGAGPGKPGDWESGQCGSGAGNAIKGEPSDQAAEGGRSESEIQQTRMTVAEAVKAHCKQQGPGRGNLPLGMDRWADDMQAPTKVPWQSVLARTVRQAVAFRPGAVDYSFSRVSRRQAGVGYGVGSPIIPAMVRPVPQVAIVLDTSGSMSQGQLSQGIAETISVLKTCGSEIDFLSCDHAVHAHSKVTSPSQLSKLVKGGGGSSFVPAFEHIARMRRRPQLAIFMTDGFIGVPERAPKGMDVIWLLIDAGDNAGSMPTTAYGKHIVIES
jgi:predicted metal-dependent peptidase